MIVAAGIALSVFGYWEMDGETWGYWYFAGVFNETGQLAAWDRSPLYVLYLSVFERFGYPLGIVLEYVFSSAIFCAAFVSLVFGTRLLIPAAIAAVWMLPAAWAASPNVQVLALGATFSGFAMLLSRRAESVRIGGALLFLSAAYLFRSTYVVALAPVVGYLLLFPRATGARAFGRRALHIARAAVPAMVLVGGLWSYAHFRQVSHPWNNVFFSSTQWFPINSKSLLDAGFVSHLNWIYIGEKYPGQKGIDFYRTNQELFGGAETAREAFQANPGFVFHALSRNVGTLFEQGGRMTRLWSPFVTVGLTGFYVIVLAGIAFALMIVVIFFSGRFRPELRLMFLSLSAVVLTTLLAMPKKRYMAGLAAVLFFVCVWAVEYFADKVARFRSRLRPALFGFAAVAVAALLPMSKRGYLLSFALILLLVGVYTIPALTGRFASLRSRLPSFRDRADPRALRGAAACALFILLSPETLDIPHMVSARLRDGARILEQPSGSMKAVQPELSSLARGCRGIMALEHTFIGAFVAEKSARVYDVFEIPPFGSLTESPYAGLATERVDCLFVSDALVAGTGTGTETFNRYHRYIRPYADLLRSRGGAGVSVPGYGHVVRAPRDR